MERLKDTSPGNPAGDSFQASRTTEIQNRLDRISEIRASKINAGRELVRETDYPADSQLQELSQLLLLDYLKPADDSALSD